MKTYYKTMLVISLAILLATTIAFTGKHQASPGFDLALQSPSFVQAASEGKVESTSSQATAKLSEEAGISAYMQTSGPLSLNQVRGLFRTIEMETTDYIIGSVNIPNYAEHWDVHVYVCTDGWILAYYLRNDVTSKIIDVKAKTVSTTILETAVSIIAGAVGEPISSLKYYDFRYPNATNILFVGEDNNNGIDFYITLPSEYIYYERSWMQYYGTFAYRAIEINGVRQPVSRSESNAEYGPIYAGTLVVEERHHVQLGNTSYYGAITITYRIP